MEQNKKQIAIITGCTGYLGMRLAQRLAQEGVTIVGLYRSETQIDADAYRASLSGVGHVAYPCDLENATAIENILDTVTRTIGPITISIHTAWSKPERSSLLKCSTESIMSQLVANIPIAATFILTCARYFKQHEHGTIFAITTAGVVTPEATKNMSGYTIAKYALQGLLVELHEELRDSPVQVFSIAPDFMEGGMNKDIPKAFVEIMRHSSPTQTLISPDDVADRIIDILAKGPSASDPMTHLITPHT